MTPPNVHVEPNIIELFVFDRVAVSESWGVSVLRALIIVHKAQGEGTVVSVAEYRKLLGDETSADERITQRLEYIEALCRGIIRTELQKYVSQNEN